MIGHDCSVKTMSAGSAELQIFMEITLQGLPHMTKLNVSLICNSVYFVFAQLL